MTDYPTTRADLAIFDPVDDLHLISTAAREYALYGHGYDQLAVGRVLGVDESTVHQLNAGSLDRVDTDAGLMPIARVSMPKAQAALVREYSQLLRACQVLPPRRIAEPLHEVVAGARVGTVDANTVSWLRSNTRGHTASWAARNANGVKRCQILTEYGVTIASLAEATGLSPDLTFKWVTGEAIPTSDALIEVERVVSFLMAGPLRGTVERTKKAEATF